MNAPVVEFRVFGDPKPQGSKKAFWNPKAKRAVIIEQPTIDLKTWRNRVYSAAVDVRPEELIQGPVDLTVVFYLKSPIKRKWPLPAKTPDLSKLIRATEEDLAGIIFANDAQICRVSAIKKWAEVDEPPGAWINVKEMS